VRYKGGYKPSYKPAPFAERFWQYVVETEGCWLWTGTINKAGYGQITPRKGHKALAHRLSWMMLRGDIPPGMCVLHHCDNPPCVNPEHLFIGTAKDNMQDMYRKGRARPGGKK
jgi:hypothetical protein